MVFSENEPADELQIVLVRGGDSSLGEMPSRIAYERQRQGTPWNVWDAAGMHACCGWSSRGQRCRVHLSHFSEHFLDDGAKCGFNELQLDMFGMLAAGLVDSALNAKD